MEVYFTLSSLAPLVEALIERELRHAIERENIAELSSYPGQRDGERPMSEQRMPLVLPRRTAQALPGRTHPRRLQGSLHRPRASGPDPARRLHAWVSGGKASQRVFTLLAALQAQQGRTTAISAIAREGSQG
jgi:hypothetical protein